MSKIEKLKPLKTQDQIEVIKSAIEKLTTNEGFMDNGICYSLDKTLMDKNYLGNDDDNYAKIEVLIPLFSHSIAVKLASKYDYQTPTGTFFWWDKRNNEVRVKYLQALIEELKKEQQIQALEECKELVRKGTCVCDALSEKYRAIVNDGNIFFRQLPKFFPMLTHENAIIACREKHVVLPKPYINSGMLYWERDNSKSRIAFVNWMIQQIKG